MFVEKIFNDAKLPERANPTDSGADIFIHHFCDLYLNDPSVKPNGESSIVLRTNDRVIVSAGIAATVGPGFEIQVRARSGNAAKKGLIVVNGPGTIDESYIGEIKVIIANISHNEQELKIGDKIAQLVVCPVILDEIIQVEKLKNTKRGENGFGSTGN